MDFLSLFLMMMNFSTYHFRFFYFNFFPKLKPIFFCYLAKNMNSSFNLIDSFLYEKKRRFFM